MGSGAIVRYAYIFIFWHPYYWWKVLKQRVVEFIANRKERMYYLSLIVIGICFFFFCGEHGYVLEKDSLVYIEDNNWILAYGYIIYPMIIKLFRILSPEDYLEIVFVFQSLIALISSLIVVEYLRKTYDLRRRTSIFVLILSFGPYAYTLPQYVSSHGIITEGITFPLFNLWFICILQFCLHNRKRWFVLAIVLSVLMILTRPQLLVILVIDVLIAVYVCIKLLRINKRIKGWEKGILVFATFVITAIVGNALLCSFLKNSYLPQLTDAMAGRVLCTIQEDDEELYSDEMKPLFDAVFMEVEGQRSRQEYFREDIRRWEDICNATNINAKMIDSIIASSGVSSQSSYRGLSVTKLKGEFIYPLFIRHWDEYVAMTFELIVQSMVVSIFVHPDWAYTLGYCVAILLYLLSLLLFYFVKRNSNCAYYTLPFGIIMMVILIMCVLTNIIFMGIQRYVVYAFGWFYISIVILMKGYFQNGVLLKNSTIKNCLKKTNMESGD